MPRAPFAWLAAILLVACSSSPPKPEPLSCPAAPACPACPQCPPAKPPPEAARYEESSFAALPGWGATRLAPSLRAFLGSCPRAGALDRACELGRAVNQDDETAVRQFFEAVFIPYA